MPELTGSLQVFRVQEVLGLIARKPGSWLIGMRDKHPAYVGLHEGRVVCVSSDTTRQDFARRLVIEGAVGTTSLAQALREADDDGVVGRLLEDDLIDPDMLPALAHQHIVSSLADLTHWRAGSFSAAMVNALPDDVGVSVGLTDLGAEITALLRRWRVASDSLGGLTTVMSAHPGAVPAHLRGLHALIDGRRTVADLIEASGHGTVGTMVDLADLVQAGCAAPILAGTAEVQQQLAMLSVLETPVAPDARPGPHLAVINGGASADDVEEAGPAAEAEPDLLTVILRGVRGV